MKSFRGIQGLNEIPKKMLQKQNLNYIFGNQEEGQDLLLTLQERNMGVSGGDARHLAMVVPITFPCNSLGAARFIKVYVFLYMFHCNSQINGALFVTEWKGTPSTFFNLII